jgi:hypothetical protein
MPVPRIQLRVVQLIVAVAALVCAVILRAAWIIEDGWHLLLGTLAFQAYLGIRQPAGDGGPNDGGADDNPFSPFRRWTWTAPPERWRQAVGSGLLFGLLVFPGLAVCFYFFKSEHPQWGFIAFFIFLGLQLTFSSIRIWARVRVVRNHPDVEQRCQASITERVRG